MVISSSSQWSVALNSSNQPLTGSSPSLIRQGSMLGIKTCQLSAPQHAIIPSPELHHHQEPHSTSSRRLQGAEQAPSRRSAGSFRQLVYGELGAAGMGQEDGLWPRSPGWVPNAKHFDDNYDGIAIPWSTYPHRPPDVAPEDAVVRVNLVDMHGEITADDVDLLPLPGLLNCSSSVYEDCHLPHRQSTFCSSRKMDMHSPNSPANSCKSSVVMPDYLGLPLDHPNTGTSDNISSASAPLTPPVSAEHARSADVHISCGGHGYGVKQNDDFVDSLAGLWTNAPIHVEPQQIFQNSESLTSIFNIYPQNFHELSSPEQSCIEIGGNESVPLVVDDLESLVKSSRRGCHEKIKRSRSLQTGKTFTSGKSANNVPLRGVQEVDDGARSISASVAAKMTSPVKTKLHEGVSLKRTFSMHDLNSMASSITATSAPFAGSNAWRPAESSSMGLRISMEEHQGFNKTASLQSMPQNGPIYSGSHYHDIAEKHNGVMQEEDSVPKPPPTKVRRKHGTAMDPQSIAARTRRERFSDRIRTLQRLVPNAERLDTVSMLGQTLEYVRFLQHQVSELYHGKDPAAPSNVCEKWKDFMEAECASANQGGSI